jgi:hypothetical protein
MAGIKPDGATKVRAGLGPDLSRSARSLALAESGLPGCAEVDRTQAKIELLRFLLLRPDRYVGRQGLPVESSRCQGPKCASGAPGSALHFPICVKTQPGVKTSHFDPPTACWRSAEPRAGTEPATSSLPRIQVQTSTFRLQGDTQTASTYLLPAWASGAG